MFPRGTEPIERRFRAGGKGRSGIRFRAEPYPVDTALELERATGLERPGATGSGTRRGFGDPDAAARFSGLAKAVIRRVRGHGRVGEGPGSDRTGEKITVYGDFDATGHVDFDPGRCPA